MTRVAGSMVGLWVEIPTPSQHRCVAHVVRHVSSLIFSYFFAADEDLDLVKLRAGDAFYAARTGYLGIRKGQWPVLGRTTVDKGEWPIVDHARAFTNSDGLVDHWALHVAEDFETVIRRTKVSAVTAQQLPEYGAVLGHVSTQRKLGRMLDEGRPAMKSYTWWPGQFDRLPEPALDSARHSWPFRVEVEFSGSPRDDLDQLARRLKRGIPRGDEFDGWERDLTTTTLYLYSHDYRQLVAAVREVGRSANLPPDAQITVSDSDSADYEEILREPLW